jgi:hypothetical protein
MLKPELSDMSLTKYYIQLRLLTQLDLNARLLYLERPLSDFTRKSPLSFPRTVTLILSLLRRTLAVELFTFFTDRNQSTVTKSALCQRRQLIKPQFFKDFFNLSASAFYQCFKSHRRWRGKLIFAVDGTGQTLPPEYEIGLAFGFHRNQHDSVPSTRILCTYDLLNNIIYRIDFHTQKSGEITNAYPNVAKLPKDAIYIYDRGFQGYGLPFLHLKYGSDCIIRIQAGMTPEVKDFVQSKDNERVITVNLKGRALKAIQKLDIDVQPNAEMKLRLIRVELKTGEIEVLLTTLMDRKKYHYKRIGENYGARWGVETAFLIVKSFLQLALVSSYKPDGVRQDIWATFAFFNQQSAIIQQLASDLKRKTKDRQYSYKINRNVTAGLIKIRLSAIFLDGQHTWRAKTKVLLKECLKHIEPYRPRTSRERKKRKMFNLDRHSWEYNFRSAF